MNPPISLKGLTQRDSHSKMLMLPWIFKKLLEITPHICCILTQTLLSLHHWNQDWAAWLLHSKSNGWALICKRINNGNYRCIKPRCWQSQTYAKDALCALPADSSWPLITRLSTVGAERHRFTKTYLEMWLMLQNSGKLTHVGITWKFHSSV